MTIKFCEQTIERYEKAEQMLLDLLKYTTQKAYKINSYHSLEKTLNEKSIEEIKQQYELVVLNRNIYQKLLQYLKGNRTISIEDIVSSDVKMLT